MNAIEQHVNIQKHTSSKKEKVSFKVKSINKPKEIQAHSSPIPGGPSHVNLVSSFDTDDTESIDDNDKCFVCTWSFSTC